MNIDRFLGVHANAIQQRGQRAQVLASNIANADTPNYKARDLAFADTLRQQGSAAAQRGPASVALASTRLKRTDARHLGASHVDGHGSTTAALKYRVPDAPSLDGNTVDKDMEQARFAENAIRYQASIQFMKSRVDGLQRVLRGE